METIIYGPITATDITIVLSSPRSFSERSESWHDIKPTSISTTLLASTSSSEPSPTFSSISSELTSTTASTVSSKSTIAANTASSSPSATPLYTSRTNSHKPPHTSTSTIVGAVLGPIVFLLLLSLGVLFLRRGHKTKTQRAKSPDSDPVSRQIRISSQDEGKGGRLTTGPRNISASLDDNSPEPGHEPSLSGRAAEREDGDRQVLAEETILHSASPQPMLMSDEAAEEILSLRTQIEQLIGERALSVWNPYSESDPPPAYVEAVNEDG
ncbi:uncharacterized protein EV420DRAFT_1650479 [Desarmillaria tabescens]|uniref:Mid2 domain-containing protein n=1 Tax=Armillaria tabescens TaxID=1929756 RepID=A0AA39JES5_ARMTA|nr:uncharacterized protein EV420DRAFT_1650479 [Desarmillaria tabescens]KAK0440456.1 hypothetical protein EV420DRAFT_1650479 [Desarmillaria tabescens]